MQFLCEKPVSFILLFLFLINIESAQANQIKENNTVNRINSIPFSNKILDILNTKATAEKQVVLHELKPYHHQLEVFTDTEFEMYFSEEITAGSGDVYIINAITREVAANISASDINFYGYQLSFAPPQTLMPFTTYFVLVDSGAIVSKYGAKAFKGIQSEFTWRFITNNGADTQAPSFIDNAPLTKSIGTDFFALQIGLNEPGTVHYVVLKDSLGLILPSAEQVALGKNAAGKAAHISGSIDVNEASTLKLLEINKLAPFTQYRVLLIAKDFANNFQKYTHEVWIKTKENVQQQIVVYKHFPSNGSAGVELDKEISIIFSEAIVPNSGVIHIYNKSLQKTAAKIDIQNQEMVNFSGNYLSIKTPLELEPNTEYSITMDIGAVIDKDGNKAFMGVNNWVFTTKGEVEK